MNFLKSGIGQLVFFSVGAIGLAVLAFRQQKAKWFFSLKKRKKKILKQFLICYLLIIATSILWKLLAFSFSGTSAQKPVNQQLIETLDKSSFWDWTKLGLIILIWAPIVEELVFRWLLFEIFGKNYLSILLSALTFCLAHYQGEKGLAQILVFFVYPTLGFILAYTYYKKKNLIWPIAIHFLNNLIAFLLLLLSLLKN